MPDPSRPPRWEKSCPIPATHTRLHQVHRQWHRVAADYSDPDDFITSLNAALASLRSVPEVLQRTESRRLKDFATWYEPFDIAFRRDPLLKWLVAARNTVLHERDLTLHSRAHVTVLVDGREVPGIDIDVPPLSHQEEIAMLIAPRLPDHIREVGVLAVERRWVADNLPDHELLDVLAYGYGEVAKMVADAHLQCGVRMQTFGDEDHDRRPQRREQLGGRLSCMVAHARLRTAHVHLARQELMVAERRDRSFTRQELADFKPGVEITDAVITPDASILDNGEGLMHAACAVFDHQGFHTPTAMIFETHDLPPTILDLHASDAQEQVLMIEAVVEAVERSHAEGIVFISEMRNLDSGEGELVVAALTDDGGRRVWRTQIERSDGGDQKTGRTLLDEDATPTFLLPIERAWTAMGRGRS